MERQAVLHSYKTLIKLIKRLPEQQRQPALKQARATCKERKQCPEEQRLSHLKELASRIGYLRAVTPRLPGDVADEGGKFVMRDGVLVAGEGEASGTRVASSALSHSEAMAKNNAHFKRFYGADKPKEVFF